jgi:uncharacterized protein DUF4953/uncharacterized protein DUF5117
MKPLVATLILFAACAAAPAPPPAAQPQPPVKPALQKIDGYLPLYWNEESGKLLMEIPRLGEEMLYHTALPAGVGSNPIGLDRNQIGSQHIVRFERVGPRVLMVEPNYRFRAMTNDAAERRAVEESFAQSVLAGFNVVPSMGPAVVVDATDFFLSDMHGVATQLRDTKQGNYSLDRNRSAIYLQRTKGFPRNTEVEATLTFATNDRPGELIGGVTPTAEAVTVREHHSFVALPEPGYKPRRADPRVGIIPLQFADYGSPFTGPLETRWILRHRLEKKDPSAAVSEPVKPIVYYVDNGVPEPIRSALLEGASWWSEAFEAAGFKNAFQVKVLPADADPMDARYNVINWVHRSTRGWSMGDAVIDPRTGEIVKGNVILGSLRIRQDVLIARGLIPQYDELGDEALSQLDPVTSPPMMALARIRQLSAHETGHTLGLDHNMAASSYGRASVMDYPAPNVKITNGRLDLSDAYAKGIGAYDKFVIRYAYAQFAPGANEETELEKIAAEAPLFVKDPDARPVSAAHPQGSVWDGGSDPIAMLRHEIEVRRIALDQFGLRNIAVGQPLSSLEETLLPLYLHHRYQLEAAAKSIGGTDYRYSVKTKGGISPLPMRVIVSPERQRDALAAVLSTLDPKFLAIPQRIINLIPPRAYGYETGTAELFDKRTAPAFDPIAAVTVAADITVSALLEPHRCARLIQFHDEDAANPSMSEVVDRLIDVALRSGAIARTTRSIIATRLMDLAAAEGIDPQVRAQAAASLRKLAAALEKSRGDDEEIETAHRVATRDDILKFLERPDAPRKRIVPPGTPPGPPI